MGQLGQKLPLFGWQYPKWRGFEKKSVFLGVLGGFRPPNSAKLFLGPKEKKVRNFFSDRQWVQTPAKPLFIEIEIEKKSIFGRKKFDPKLPQNMHVVSGPPAAQGSGGAH